MSDRTRPAYSHEELRRLDHAHLWHPFTPMQAWFEEDPVVIVRGDGNELIDDGGRRYLDGVSSLWCNVHGHNHPALNAAITAQLGQVAHTTLLGLTNMPAVRLAERLVNLAPPGLTRVFYSDSGATAEEAALKMALQYWHLSGKPSKTRFASLVQAYHGDTLGAVGVGYSETFHRFFKPVLADALRLTPPHVRRWRDRLSHDEALDQAITEARESIAREGNVLAAVVVEPLMQGAAGMWPHSPDYLRALREATTEAGVLLICDEVATGFGRTGTMFACEQAGVAPDLLCVAKGITGGYLPLAATLATERIHDAFLGPPAAGRTFYHGHTYTGNPLGCAAALASLDLFDSDRTLDRLGPKVARLQQRLAADVAALPHVADVRQCGVMVGIELAADAAERRPYPAAERMGARVTREARRRGVIVRPLGDVVVLMPPLSITGEEIDRLVTVVHDAIAAATAT
jgi:adenosylmethionine-8-amino-7-oxononanoate aminotransferase